MPDAKDRLTESIIGGSLITAETLAQDIRERLVKELSTSFYQRSLAGKNP